MTKLIITVLLGWSQLWLCVDGARKEKTAALQVETRALRQKAKVVLAQVKVSAETDGHLDTESKAKVSLWQDPYIPVHPANGMTSTVPGHRSRAFVVAGILFALMVMLFAAIFASIHRKVSEDLATPVNPQRPSGFQGLLGHSLSSVHIAHHGLRGASANFPKRDVKTLRAESPGDLRRVEDEFAELTKDLTPPSSPGAAKPEPAIEPASIVQTTSTPERSVETILPPASSDLSPLTPSKITGNFGVHSAFSEAPLPTPPPRSPPKRRKRKNEDTATSVDPWKNEASIVPPSDLRDLDDEFAALTRDLFPQSEATPSDLTPHVFQGFSAKDFAEVKTLRAVCTPAELRSHDDEFSEVIQDLLPSSKSSSALGELRSFQDEISELADDLHTQDSAESETHERA